jgi:ribosomal 30S subunit maturation factor RimM
MKRNLLSLAIATVLAGSAYAQTDSSNQGSTTETNNPLSAPTTVVNTTAPDSSTVTTTDSAAKTATTNVADNSKMTMASSGMTFRASDLIGLKVKNASDDTIGKIDDLLIQSDEVVLNVVLSVGGFLGMGDQLVAVPYHQLQVSRKNGTDQATYHATKAELEALPEFSYDVLAEGPMLYRANNLIGQNVKNASGDTIGEIDNIIIGAEDKALHAIISVGGFLGIGDKLVAVPFDQLKIDRVKDKNQVQYEATKVSLEAMPGFIYQPSS